MFPDVPELILSPFIKSDVRTENFCHIFDIKDLDLIFREALSLQLYDHTVKQNNR